MSMKYISLIQSKMKKYKTLRTSKATSSLLDGSYRSIFKGRSLDFNELREYVPGDDVKDISWNASARSNKILVKQYVAEKKHNILLVMDTNRRMLAYTNESEEKREAALISAGTLAYLVNQNGDSIGGIFSTNHHIHQMQLKTGLGNIEHILEQYHKSTTEENYSDLNDTLDYIVRHYRRKMIIVLVTDLKGASEITDTNLKRLQVMNDVVLITVGDADSFGKQVYNIENNGYLPSFLTKNNKLKERQIARYKKYSEICQEKYTTFGVPRMHIEGTQEIDRAIVALFSKRSSIG